MKMTREDLRTQKDMLELQVALGKYVSKEACLKVANQTISDVVSEYVEVYSQEVVYNIAETFVKLFRENLYEKN
jgi:hypothetical protein